MSNVRSGIGYYQVMKEKNAGDILPDLNTNQEGKNHLFPVFLKLEELEVLVVGAGKVGLEKLNAILQNAPESSVTVVASEISPEVRQLTDSYPRVKLIERAFEPDDLEEKESVVLA